jgi:hypothetical protein
MLLRAYVEYYPNILLTLGGGLDLVFPSPTPSQLQDPRVHPPPVCFNFCQQIVSRLGGYVIIP